MQIHMISIFLAIEVTNDFANLTFDIIGPLKSTDFLQIINHMVITLPYGACIHLLCLKSLDDPKLERSSNKRLQSHTHKLKQ